VNIYLAKRTTEADWDEFDDMVVVAESIDEAKLLVKNEIVRNSAYEDDGHYSVRYHREYEYELLDMTESRVVVSSYNAG